MFVTNFILYFQRQWAEEHKYRKVRLSVMSMDILSNLKLTSRFSNLSDCLPSCLDGMSCCSLFSLWFAWCRLGSMPISLKSDLLLRCDITLCEHLRTSPLAVTYHCVPKWWDVWNIHNTTLCAMHYDTFFYLICWFDTENCETSMLIGFLDQRLQWYSWAIVDCDIKLEKHSHSQPQS